MNRIAVSYKLNCRLSFTVLCGKQIFYFCYTEFQFWAIRVAQQVQTFAVNLVTWT